MVLPKRPKPRPNETELERAARALMIATKIVHYHGERFRPVQAAMLEQFEAIQRRDAALKAAQAVLDRAQVLELEAIKQR